MTVEEYKKLERFKKEDHIFKISTSFENNDIFEIHTSNNQIKYLKIRDSFENLLFDLTECTSDGETVRCPFTRNSITRSEILDKIEDNLWRLFKKTNND